MSTTDTTQAPNGPESQAPTPPAPPPAGNNDKNGKAPTTASDAKKAPKDKAAKPKKEKKKVLDVEMLQDLANQISEHRGGANMADLIARLQLENALTLKETKKGSGIYVAKLAGIETKPVKSERQALFNWANKARREILQAA